jgi:ATP-dependent Zn protease
MIAEELSGYGRTTSNDLPEATVKAEEMVKEFGMGRRIRLRFIDGDTPMSPWLKSSIDRDIRDLMDQAYRQACRVIAKHLDQVKAVAELLLKRRRIDKKDLEKLLGPKT